MQKNINYLINGDNISVLEKSRVALLFGFYIDTLFVKNEGIFIQSIKFLVNNLNYAVADYEGDARYVLSLQSIETLNTIIGDEDLAARLEPFLGEILQCFNSLTLKVQTPMYFDFLVDLVRGYSDEIGG
jgi:hypothetical protein